VEYIDFWLQDPFQDNPTNPGGKLVLNLGNISEDIIKDGKKLYENGLPNDGDVSILRENPTSWEDINRDNTMNTIDSYFEYELDLTRQNLPQTLADFENLPNSNPLKQFLRDFKSQPRAFPNGDSRNVTWYQFRIPVQGSHVKEINNPELRSVRFSRIYLKDFQETTVFRFGTLDLVRSDWRRFTQALDRDDATPDDPQTEFSVGVIGTLENEGSYQRPPGIEPEQLFNNNTVVRQNEQSLVVKTCDLETEDSRGVFKNINIDMRQYKRMTVLE